MKKEYEVAVATKRRDPKSREFVNTGDIYTMRVAIDTEMLVDLAASRAVANRSKRCSLLYGYITARMISVRDEEGRIE